MPLRRQELLRRRSDRGRVPATPDQTKDLENKVLRALRLRGLEPTNRAFNGLVVIRPLTLRAVCLQRFNRCRRNLEVARLKWRPQCDTCPPAIRSLIVLHVPGPNVSGRVARVSFSGEAQQNVADSIDCAGDALVLECTFS